MTREEIRDVLAPALSADTEPTTVRAIVARLDGKVPSETKQDLSRLALALRLLGWQRGQQVAGSKGSYFWWPPRKQ